MPRPTKAEALHLVNDLVGQLRSQLPDGAGVLGAPIPGVARAFWYGRVPYTCLLKWGFYNPFGPNLYILSAVALPTGESILTLHHDHPLVKERTALGLAPAAGADIPLSLLEDLFAHTQPDGRSILIGPPTYVVHAGNAADIDMTRSPVPDDRAPLLDADAARRLMWVGLKAVPVVECRLALAVRQLKRYYGDVQTAAFLGTSHLSRRGTTFNEDLQKIYAPAYYSTFKRWFDLVTDPYNVTKALIDINTAWWGSQFMTGRLRFS